MCGITGIFDLRERRPINRALLEAMNQTQFHRGPDEGGVHLEPGVGLAHRRLSIIDLSSGQQPLFNEDESVVVTYNGEIYNFPELTRELEQAGTASAPTATPRSSSMPGRSGARPASSAFAVCSPSASGIATARPCS